MARAPKRLLPAKFLMDLNPGSDHQDWFVVTVKGTPVVSQGRGVADAIANGHEALACYLDALASEGVRVPKKYTVSTRVTREA